MTHTIEGAARVEAAFASADARVREMNAEAQSKWAFQDVVIRDALRALAKHSRVMIRAATAAGKTTVARRLLSRYVEGGQTIWFVVNRDHLVKQAEAEMARLQTKIGVIQRGRAASPDAQLQICMVQSLPSRLGKYPQPDIVVWDEAQHVLAPSWKKIADAFPDAEHLGLSATPERMDGRPLGDCFRALVLAPPEEELEALGVLAPCRYFAPAWENLPPIELRNGDYDRLRAAAIMTNSQLAGDPVEHYRKHAEGRAAILFAANIAASLITVDRFRAAGIAAEHLDGDIPLEHRDRVLRRLECGEIQIVSNVDVFVEGLNVPAIGAVILMRPTKSLARFLQMIGRGRRVTDRYDDLVILDHAGNFFDHGLPNDERAWSLTEARPKWDCAAASETMQRCEVCGCVYRSAGPCPEGCDRSGRKTERRSIVEQRGALVEIICPAGCETLAAFAKRVGRLFSTVWLWTKKPGFPMKGAFVDIRPAQDWVYMNTRSAPPSGCETVADFARRLGVNEGTVWLWTKKPGFPMKGTFVDIEAAQDWVYMNTRGAPPSGCEAVADFARRLGVSENTVWCWTKKPGFPMKGAFVDIKPAQDWVYMNTRSAPPSGCETQADFARRLSVSTGTVWCWTKKPGFPMKGTFVDIEAAQDWVYMNTRGAPPSGCETQADFARRLGVSKKALWKWTEEPGFPLNAVFVDITAALDWIAKHKPKFTKVALRALNP